MNLHHLVTCSLFVGMILQNYIRVGVIISWLHSVSDITTGFSRILSHTLYKSAALVSFSICIVKWIYLRNICIPIVCYNIWMYLNYYNELTNFFMASRILASSSSKATVSSVTRSRVVFIDTVYRQFT